jgi:hypothetical protein
MYLFLTGAQVATIRGHVLILVWALIGQKILIFFKGYEQPLESISLAG